MYTWSTILSVLLTCTLAHYTYHLGYNNIMAMMYHKILACIYNRWSVLEKYTTNIYGSIVYIVVCSVFNREIPASDFDFSFSCALTASSTDCLFIHSSTTCLHNTVQDSSSSYVIPTIHDSKR